MMNMIAEHHALDSRTRSARPYRRRGVGVTLILALLVLLAPAAFHPSSAHAADVVVNIPDANLQAAVRLALVPLGENTGSITDKKMRMLTHLDANGLGITDLTGLSYATNMTTLALNNNNIANLAPLQGLTSMTVLALASNQVTNVTPLASMTDLTELNLEGNRLTSIAPLTSLSNLQILRVNNNTITNLTPVASLTKLYSLVISDNQVADITAVAGLANLQYFYAGGNLITSVAPVAGLSNLLELKVGYNYLDLTLGSATQVGILALQNRGVVVEYLPQSTLARLSAPRKASGTIYMWTSFPITGTIEETHTGSAYVYLKCSRTIGGTPVYTFRATIPAGSKSYSAKVKLPAAGTWYIRAYHSDSTHEASYSPSSKVIVSGSISVSSPRVRTKMSVNHTYKNAAYGTIKPRHSSAYLVINAYRWSGHKYVYKKHFHVKMTTIGQRADTSKYMATIKLTQRGTWRLKLRHSAHAGEPRRDTGYSAKITVK